MNINEKELEFNNDENAFVLNEVSIIGIPGTSYTFKLFT